MLTALAAFAAQAAVVYKWTDSDGVVHYSDQPVPGAEKIYTASSTTATAPTGHATADSQTPGPKKEQPGAAFAVLAITSPTPDQTFFGDELINVSLAVSPSLKPEQSITWHLNGKQLDDQGPTVTHFVLPHLDRGTYAIAATVTDQATGESQSTDSVTFFVHQPSELSPEHKRP